MKITITGGSGLLGKELKIQYPSIVTPTRKDLDILNEESVKKYLSVLKTDVFIHCAALTSQSLCENNKELAINTNLIGTANISRFCKYYEIPMIYISTDYIFDGLKGSPYNEEDNPDPGTYYAKTKWWGEIATFMCDHRIIRTSFCSKEKWPYEYAYVDKYSSRDTVDKIAELILTLVKGFKKWSGIINVGTKRKSFFELAKSISKDVKPNSINDVDFFVGPDTSFSLIKMNRILENLQK